jgi:hypothetical protein
VPKADDLPSPVVAQGQSSQGDYSALDDFAPPQAHDSPEPD